jgi:hypothetical protein
MESATISSRRVWASKACAKQAQLESKEVEEPHEGQGDVEMHEVQPEPEEEALPKPEEEYAIIVQGWQTLPPPVTYFVIRLCCLLLISILNFYLFFILNDQDFTGLLHSQTRIKFSSTHFFIFYKPFTHFASK